VVAAACLLLAGKVEETPKKCRDILKVAQSILTEQQMANFGSNPKEELLTHERILLQTIKFDLQVQHPYFFLLKYAKTLRGVAWVCGWDVCVRLLLAFFNFNFIFQILLFR